MVRFLSFFLPLSPTFFCLVLCSLHQQHGHALPLFILNSPGSPSASNVEYFSFQVFLLITAGFQHTSLRDIELTSLLCLPVCSTAQDLWTLCMIPLWKWLSCELAWCWQHLLWLSQGPLWRFMEKPFSGDDVTFPFDFLEVLFKQLPLLVRDNG